MALSFKETTTTNTAPILFLGDDVTSLVFAFLGASSTARCGRTCQTWNSTVRNSRALWRHFVAQDFGLVGQGSDAADWYTIYGYIKTQQQEYQETHDPQPHRHHLPCQFVWCDDGSHQPGNNPEHALNTNANECWCTNAFVDKDVDFVARFEAPCLVLAFEIRNGGHRFSAPVKEALVFADYQLPNLEFARKYDGAPGIALAQQLQDPELSNNHDNNNQQLLLSPGHPLAGFQFPGIPQAFHSRRLNPVVRPTVARFAHFKLLTSSKCSDRVSNNIDVCSLLAYGILLPDLEAMLYPTATAGASAAGDQPASMPHDPSAATHPHPQQQQEHNYQRRYEVRDYPWHIHDQFRAQQLQLQFQPRQGGQARIRQVIHNFDFHNAAAEVERLGALQHRALEDLNRLLQEAQRDNLDFFQDNFLPSDSDSDDDEEERHPV